MHNAYSLRTCGSPKEGYKHRKQGHLHQNYLSRIPFTHSPKMAGTATLVNLRANEEIIMLLCCKLPVSEKTPTLPIALSKNYRVECLDPH